MGVIIIRLTTFILAKTQMSLFKCQKTIKDWYTSHDNITKTNSMNVLGWDSNNQKIPQSSKRGERKK